MTMLWNIFKIIALCGLCVVTALFFLMLTIVLIVVFIGMTRKKQD